MSELMEEMSVRRARSSTAFFYGTLMAPQVLYRVLWQTSTPLQRYRDRLTISPAVLHSYCRHKVYMADYPGIVPEEGKSVKGTYVTGLTEANIRNLDLFEGSQYRREKVTVSLLEGVEQMETGGVETAQEEAETYVFIDETDLVKEEWDFTEFVREKMHRWADSSVEYEEVDREGEVEDHDPTGGRGVNGNMDSQLSSTEGDEDDRPDVLWDGNTNTERCEDESANTAGREGSSAPEYISTPRKITTPEPTNSAEGKDTSTANPEDINIPPAAAKAHDETNPESPPPKAAVKPKNGAYQASRPPLKATMTTTKNITNTNTTTTTTDTEQKGREWDWDTWDFKRSA